MKYLWTTLVAILLLVFSSQYALAVNPWTAKTDFNCTACDTEDLNTKTFTNDAGWSAAWSANVAYDMDEAITCEGSASALVTVPADGIAATRSLTTSLANGIIHIAMRRSGTTVWRWSFELRSGTNRVSKLSFDSNGGINANGTDIGLGSYLADTWHGADVDFKEVGTTTTNTWRARVDGGAWSAYQNSIDGVGGNVDGIRIIIDNVSGSGNQDFFIDNIDVTESAASCGGVAAAPVFDGTGFLLLLGLSPLPARQKLWAA